MSVVHESHADRPPKARPLKVHSGSALQDILFDISQSNPPVILLVWLFSEKVKHLLENIVFLQVNYKQSAICFVKVTRFIVKTCLDV